MIKRAAALVWSLLLFVLGLALFPFAVVVLLVVSAWRAAYWKALAVESWRAKVKAGQRP